MTDSILESVKKLVNIHSSDPDFDLDVILHTNTALGILTQLGVGPTAGFMIEDDTATWQDFLGTDPRLTPAKSFVYLQVRLLFDPPTTGPQIKSFEEMKQELAWRLNVTMEETIWVDPNPPVIEEEEW